MFVCLLSVALRSMYFWLEQGGVGMLASNWCTVACTVHIPLNVVLGLWSVLSLGSGSGLGTWDAVEYLVCVAVWGKTVDYHLEFIGSSQVGMMLYIIGNILPNTTRTHTFRHYFFSLTEVIERKHQFVIWLYSHNVYFHSTVQHSYVNK